MLHGNNRMFHTHHLADFVTSVSAGVDDLVSCDIAVFRMDDPASIRLLRQIMNRIEALHLRAGLARAPRQRLAQLRRVDVTIQWVP